MKKEIIPVLAQGSHRRALVRKMKTTPGGFSVVVGVPSPFCSMNLVV